MLTVLMTRFIGHYLVYSTRIVIDVYYDVHYLELSLMCTIILVQSNNIFVSDVEKW